jgi:hypothetical protein
MAKDTVIVLRIDSEIKAQITAAADRQGKSVTSFITQAALKAAGKAGGSMNASLLKPKGRGPCPTYFVARCFEAQSGGENGYKGAGHTLTSNLPGEIPWDLEEGEWEARIETLRSFFGPFGKCDGEAVLSWFDENLPRCMALIPKRRRNQFLAGVCLAVDEGQLD